MGCCWMTGAAWGMAAGAEEPQPDLRGCCDGSDASCCTGLSTPVRCCVWNGSRTGAVAPAEHPMGRCWTNCWTGCERAVAAGLHGHGQPLNGLVLDDGAAELNCTRLSSPSRYWFGRERRAVAPAEHPSRCWFGRERRAVAPAEHPSHLGRSAR